MVSFNPYVPMCLEHTEVASWSLLEGLEGFMGSQFSGREGFIPNVSVLVDPYRNSAPMGSRGWGICVSFINFSLGLGV